MTRDLNENFWKEHTEYQYKEPYKTLYGADTSKKKEMSSLMMWFVVLCYAKDSEWRVMEVAQKHTDIARDFIGIPDFYEQNKVTLDMLIAAYLKDTRTAAQREVEEWERLLDTRRRLMLDDSNYTLANADQLDKMLISSNKMANEFTKLKAKADEEEDFGQARGDEELSSSDMDDM